MKKSLVALAVLAATGAYAQSSVTLFGIVEATTDIGYNRKFEQTTTNNNFNGAGVAVIGGPSSIAGFNANGTAAGVVVNANNSFGTPQSFAFTPATLNAAGALAIPTATSGNTVINNRQRNGMRLQDGSDQGSGSSRVGFRGTEDLGGGLKANFLLEMGLRIDDGCTTLGSTAPCDNGGFSANSGGSTFGRNAWGGLSGDFGEVRLGRQVLGTFLVQANSVAAGASNGLYETSAAFHLPMGGVRFSNAIKYLTPNFGGFTANLTVAAPETGSGVDTSTNSVVTTPLPIGTVVTTTGGAKRRTGYDLALEYANGPAYVGFGYNIRDQNNNTAVGVSPLTGASTNNFNPGRIKAYTLGGAYDLGVVKPFVNYTRQNTRVDRTDVFNSGVPATTNSIVSNGDSTSRFYSVGLRAPVGSATVIASYGRGDTSGMASSTAVSGAQANFYNANNKQKLTAFQIGAQYALSKRTLVEANYGQTRFENNTDGTFSNNVTLASGNQSIRANTRISALNVGLKHSF